MFPHRFETERLIIRKILISDAAAMFENWTQDHEVTKYLAWKPHSSLLITQQFLQKRLNDWHVGIQLTFVIIQKENNKLIGMIDVRIKEHRADLGYVLARNEWNKGFMTETLQGMIQVLFGQSYIYRIWATCDVDNLNSEAVLLKVGMTYEGILKGWRLRPNLSDLPRDVKSFSLIRNSN